jgi:energy-converting hydrogenase Eha subunit A
VCAFRALGELAALVADQLSVLGLYLAPEFNGTPEYPPQTTISLPVHTAVCPILAVGALVVDIAIQLSVLGLYLAPVLKPEGIGVGVGVGVGGELGLPLYLSRVSSWTLSSIPPQTIISLPVQTAVCKARPLGAFVALVGVQLSVLGSYLPPLFTRPD